MLDENESIRFYILVKLIRRGYWMRRPINFDDLKRPRIANKDLEKVCKDLVKERLLIMKPGNRGCMRYGLNTSKKTEILNERDRLEKKLE